MIKQRSKPYEPVTESDLLAMVRAAFGSAEVVAQYKLLEGGLFNTSYYIETTSNIKVILRIAPSRQNVLLGYEKRMMAS